MKKIFISLAVASCAWSIGLNAAPLPNNTLLGIAQGHASAPGMRCSTGSCFVMEIASFIVWTELGPGTDGGFIAGKAQKCGTQEFGPSSANTTPSELTTAWLFFGNYGTFCTDPGGEQNIFDDAGCTGAGCLGKTELKNLYAVWNGTKIPLGSSGGCVHPNCSADQMAGIFVSNYQINPATGGDWSFDYWQVVPSGQFLGVRALLVMRGKINVVPPVSISPTAADINITGAYGALIYWTPVVADPDGPVAPRCRIGTPPLNGVATVASDCSMGTYTADIGFVGIDSFTYIPNDSKADGAPGTVTAAITAPLPPSPIPAPDPARHLPSGSRLGITLGVGSQPNLACATGSCFGVEVAPGFVVWTNFGPGTDGGIVVGKAQKSGGQELNLSPANSTPGQITNAWFFFANYGTFFTAPGGEYNLFGNAPCQNSACIGVTELKVLNVAWNGNTIALGSSIPCSLPACTPDQQAGIFVADYQVDPVTGTWSIDYRQVVQSGGFIGAPFRVLIRGAEIGTPTVTPSPTVTPAPQTCSDQYPVSQLAQTGKQGTLTITFTGNITSHTNKEVKVCPGTTLDYQASSTQGPVICKIKNSTNPGSGTLQIRDHLKCTDKPAGKDKLNFKMKSGLVK